MSTFKKIIIFYLIIFASTNHILANQKTIFVLDTSQSVVSNTSINIMSETIKKIADEIGYQTEISFFTFDSEFQQILNNVIISKDEFYQKIDKIKADGVWTYSSLMLKELVNFLQTQGDVNVFIFSDGLDDPPPGKTTDFDSYEDTNSNIFYFYYTSISQKQKNLVREAFPQVVMEQMSSNLSQDIVTILDEIIPIAEIEIVDGITNSIQTGIPKELVININANSAIEGKEALLYIESDKKIFRIAPSIQTRFILQKGLKNFRFPYQLKNSYQGENANIFITLSLAESPEDRLDSKNIDIQIAELPFIKKLYKLPLYAIPFFILLTILLYIIYCYMRYLFFIPVIKMSYRLINNKNKGESIVNSLDLGTLENETYTISANPNAYLVLPELPRYSDLMLIKKGKKYKTRLFIHKSSLRSLYDLKGKIIRKRMIKNGTVFQMDNYIFSFKTNF